MRLSNQTPFIGRKAELQQLVDLRSTTRLLTLVGPGGVGKTRLAARLSESQSHAFRDGVRIVDVDTLSGPGALVQAVVAELMPPGARDELERLIEWLSERQILLVLDNCAPIIVECAGLATSLLRACPGLEVLATSREPLGIDGETVWRVPPLGCPSAGAQRIPESLDSDAVHLFVACVGAHQPAFVWTSSNTLAAARICQRMGGMPLALEIVAHNVRGQEIGLLAARLDAEYALRLTGRNESSPRHRTLRATLDWSFVLLTDCERILLRRLAAFVGGWTLGAAQAVCSNAALPGASVTEVLERLVSRSLVQVDSAVSPTRYRFATFVRQYLLNVPEDGAERTAVSRRHAEYVLEVAAGHEPRLDAAHAEHLDQEQGNLRAALRWAILASEVDLACQLAIAAHAYWYLRSRFAEGYFWLARCLQLPESGAQPHLRPLVKCLAAHLGLLTGHVSTARSLVDAALSTDKAVGNPEGIALATVVLSQVALLSGDLVAARRFCEDNAAALTSVLGEGDRVRGLTFAMLTVTARVAWELHDARRAGQLATNLARMARAHEHRFWLARALHVQALVANGAGQHLFGLWLMERTVALQQAHGDTEGLTDSLCSLGHFRLDHGAHREGLAAFGEALRLASGTGHRVGMVWALEGVARALGPTRPEDAVGLAAACETFRSALGCAMWPNQHRRAAAWLARTRARLSPAAYRAARRVGLSWGYGEAMRRATAVPDAAPVLPEQLTPREGQVAQLLAEGSSNRQIAARLTVSVGTVRVHVDHILAKLGLHSRAQVAVWAVQREWVLSRQATAESHEPSTTRSLPAELAEA